jgi:hypothetical protein
MTLLMSQGKSSGSSSLAIFVFLQFSCSYETQMNECFTMSIHDHPLSALFFTFAGPAEHLRP